MKGLSLILLISIMLKACVCWWDMGHMLVAKVAEVTLMKEDPDAFDLANRISSILNIFSHGKVNNFVESACWPDDLKEYSLRAMDNWHFINVPVNLTSVIEFINVTSTSSDAVGILKSANKSLNTWKDFETKNMNLEFEKSLLIRYLIHVLGDIHQPLHAVTLLNEKFPKGDMGGNLFLIKYKNNINNLHKLFDSGADKLGDSISRPLSHKSNVLLKNRAEEFMSEFPKKELPEFRSAKDFEDWIVESHKISKEFIYAEIKYNSRPTEEYMQKSFEIVKRRIALGGYRLAEIIKSIKKSHDLHVNVEKSGIPKDDGLKFLNLVEQ